MFQHFFTTPEFCFLFRGIHIDSKIGEHENHANITYPILCHVMMLRGTVLLGRSDACNVFCGALYAAIQRTAMFSKRIDRNPCTVQFTTFNNEVRWDEIKK